MGLPHCVCYFFDIMVIMIIIVNMVIMIDNVWMIQLCTIDK